MCFALDACSAPVFTFVCISNNKLDYTHKSENRRAASVQCKAHPCYELAHLMSLCKTHSGNKLMFIICYYASAK